MLHSHPQVNSTDDTYLAQTSVPLLLGIDFIDLIPRTVVPATGLMLVIGLCVPEFCGRPR